MTFVYRPIPRVVERMAASEQEAYGSQKPRDHDCSRTDQQSLRILHVEDTIVEEQKRDLYASDREGEEQQGYPVAL